jgi:hypothetical protein
MANNPALAKFGKFIVEQLRDEPLDMLTSMSKQELKAPALKKIQSWYGELSKKDQRKIRELFDAINTSTLHNFLASLQEASDRDHGICVMVDGINVAETSDGLNGELFTSDGWIAMFSHHKKEDV